ncbi:MAG: nicotinate (nicotinamide) nucleotide adenylyltransferase [Clostridia bacterium]|nr:nicotinate (nicotinamide) nucleotide adenylyltransferase [Clostridia bacterium]
MSKIAVFGGTFNPFHIGHYEILKSLCNQAFLDRVFVLPDKIPPHKVCDYLARDEHRIEMCRIMCEDFSKAELCLIDFEREGKSYTVDTIALLKEKYPDDEFYFVIGGDMLSSLDTWYKFDELKAKTGFIAFARKTVAGFENDLQKYKRLGVSIIPIYDEITEVSSTELRCKLKRQLLPDKIYDYIVNKGIYNV